MKDLYLRFFDEQEMFTVLRPLGMTITFTPDPENEDIIETVSQGNEQYALCEVGEIYGKIGWHINLRVIDPEFDVSSLEPYRVYPFRPACVWA